MDKAVGWVCLGAIGAVLLWYVWQVGWFMVNHLHIIWSM
jgi:hypothetical protein